MSLNEHARQELQSAGLFDANSDYDGMLGDAVMELVETFARQGHSGFSAAMTVHLFSELASYKPLGPLTSDPGEWMEIAEDVAGRADLWQSRRNPEAFSNDGGRTYYLLSERDRRRWGRPWRWIPVLRNRKTWHTAVTP